MKRTLFIGLFSSSLAALPPAARADGPLTINSPRLDTTPLIELLEKGERIDKVNREFSSKELFELQKISGYLDRRAPDKIYLVPPFNADTQKDSWMSLLHLPRFEALTRIYKTLLEVSDQNDALLSALMSKTADTFEEETTVDDTETLKKLVNEALLNDEIGRTRIKQRLETLLPLIGYSTGASMDDSEIGDFIAAVIDRPVVGIVADIYYGYSEDQIKLIQKVLTAFPEIQIARMKVDPVFELVNQHAAGLSTRTSEEGSVTDQDSYITAIFNNKLDQKFLRGLENLNLSTSGGNIQIDLPFSVAMGVGMLPEMKNPFVLLFPGIFRQDKKVAIGLSGTLECSFKAEVKQNHSFSLVKKPGNIIDDRSYTKGQPVNEASIADCQLFGEDGQPVSDKNGKIDPKLLPADLAGDQAQEAVSRLELAISDRERVFIEKYTQEVSAAVSTKEAMFNEAMQKAKGWTKLPLPVTKEVESSWKVMQACHEKAAGSVCVRWSTTWDHWKFKHRTRCVKYEQKYETECHPYIKLVERLVSTEIPAYYADEFEFERMWDVTEVFPFAENEAFTVQIHAANDICLANALDGTSTIRTACRSDQLIDNAYLQQQDKQLAIAGDADGEEAAPWENGLHLEEFE